VISISGRLDEEIIRHFFLIMDISKHSIDREGIEQVGLFPETLAQSGLVPLIFQKL